MKTVERKVYYCDHCNKHGLSKGSMSRHERFCNQNPNNWHACFKYCDHLTKTSELVKSADENSPAIYKTVFTCDVLKKRLYSFIAEKKVPIFIESDMERMPLKCDLYTCEENRGKLPY